ncbi:MAG: M14 family zinc carboxypeptidase [Kiritimatiellae bacterium]|nr:M14 family zinc carboxypeptidase [Kiritimatiellia bacterium]
MTNHGKIPLQLTDAIGGTVRIARLGSLEWRVTQRFLGSEHDNAQNATWLRLDNAGRCATVRVRIRWADSRHMFARRLAYVRQNGVYQVVTGQTTPTASIYEFAARRGRSFFGPCPWYTNEDANRFLEAICRQSRLCTRRSIGSTAEGREIPCLTIGAAGDQPRRNVVIMARLHANETAGSFAVEAIARYLIGSRAARAWFKWFRFHIFPVVNPDGVANGLKLTRMGPVEQFDMERGGMISDDPTIRGLRTAVRALRPAVLLDYHSYLIRPPMLLAFDKRLLLRVLDILLAQKMDALNQSSYWYTYHSMRYRPESLRCYCHRHFGTSVLVTEIPWAHDRLPADIGRLGVRVFKALMAATLTSGDRII